MKKLPLFIIAAAVSLGLTSCSRSSSPESAAVRAILEDEAVAGVPLGASLDEAKAVLGEPDNRGIVAVDEEGTSFVSLFYTRDGETALRVGLYSDKDSWYVCELYATAPGFPLETGLQCGDSEESVTLFYEDAAHKDSTSVLDDVEVITRCYSVKEEGVGLSVWVQDGSVIGISLVSKTPVFNDA